VKITKGFVVELVALCTGYALGEFANQRTAAKRTARLETDPTAPNVDIWSPDTMRGESA
jgi:hypothetical protein